MHRRAFLTAGLTAAASAALVGGPVTGASAAPRPVRVRVTSLRPDRAARATTPFSTVGVTWRHDPRVRSLDVAVRVRRRGRWSSWHHLEVDPDAPDTGSADASARLRDGTAPLWVGPSDGVQVRLGVHRGVRPRDVRVELVDPGRSPADAPSRLLRAAASAGEDRPDIITRAQWGADESLRRGEPTYTGLPKVGFVHHTATANGYSAAEAAAMVRSVYAFHVRSRGWTDIGYNFLVDRFGRVYEGRAGGVDRPVLGTHTGGHNAHTFAVSLLGTYDRTAPPAAALAAVQRVLAWKLGAAYRDPTGTARLTSAGGGTSRFAAGTTNTFAVVSGHRDAGSTACPGSATYARMGDIRRGTRSALGAAFVAPALVGDSERDLGSTEAFRVATRTLSRTRWVLTVTRGGAVVRTLAGTADGDLVADWDLSFDGGFQALPGSYQLRLTGTADDGSGDTALPWSTTVRVRATGTGRWRPVSR